MLAKNDEDEDEDVFNDDSNDLHMANLIMNKHPSSNSSSQGSETRVQRTLFGDEVRSEPSVVPGSTSNKAFRPTHHILDYEALKTYIYPTNFEIRDYQFNIVQRVFYANTLVALPTGLGKTFIASSVILNFSRWFPEAKIIFMAPTKPLVAQQIKACLGITGLSTDKVAILLDKTRRDRREIWDEHTVFFTTPQVVENDLTSGLADPKSIVLLVIDEAHRAKGNYAYNNVVKFISRFNMSFRILGMTATPASDVEGVQEIINNLSISKLEVRTEQSLDICKYIKHKKISRISVTNSSLIEQFIDHLCTAIAPILKLANEKKIYDITDPSKINAYQAIDASQRLIKNPTIPEGLKWSNYFILQILNVVGQGLRRLSIYGVRSFYNYFSEKHKEFTTKFNNKKSTNQTAAKFYYHDSINQLLMECEDVLSKDNFIGHPKLEILIEQIKKFFDNNTTDSKVIIFTEFRESALDIVNLLENSGDNIKPHIFIGQAKEREKFDEEKFLSKGRKKAKTSSRKGSSKDDNATKARTSSEDAQLKGMNQKLQKELIKKFKEGVYNVLVATSIGEEGLDIGEVDLIICFDSTSSPIKNIQRMGRTGRKRDGKVILLFAGSEEQKFDKAMNGYEFIQNHIMQNKLISLCQSDRIIPSRYKPTVETKFIEIPKQNARIKTEEDEDEIIKLATMYMDKSSNSSKGTKRKKTPKKPEKRFFMPDNVETGFRSVTSMIKNASSESKRGVGKENRDSQSHESHNDSICLDTESEDEPSVERNASKDMSTDEVSQKPQASNMFAPKDNRQEDNPSRNPRVRSLGIKKSRTLSKVPVNTTEPEEKRDNLVSNVQRSPSTSEDSFDDVFDDGLDDQLVSIARNPSSGSFADSQDKVYTNEFGQHDGLLNESQKLELYTSYYSVLPPSETTDFYNPSEVLKSKAGNKTGAIGHSKKSQKLIDALQGVNQASE
ncbi:Piso0_005803 [Millerozyma farinosa CBS 7064]|uniref:ATP-dependent DNA helicase n=1 Tax=Pichia sorbitophila (strain ATCC MYA-4447 / BCRC 22081 / CBS 7064 / NBRC 10061 / NRRL Y-12695) TaxID=559304 RepID=G8Y2Z0_PICSO|nr:Piso0_005803 [Millerozyma farinosa CBS 7064]